VKARKVKGLKPDMALVDAAERIVRVRLDELCALAPAAMDPTDEKALHDMRIAAKRLRYVLEVTAPCFGRDAATAAKRARDLQDVAGEIHDCDEMLPEVHERLEELRSLDATTLREDAYRGLEVLASHLSARRALLHERLAARWGELVDEDFAGRLRADVAQR
jgi:CHAD domain-containing protein